MRLDLTPDTELTERHQIAGIVLAPFVKLQATPPAGKFTGLVIATFSALFAKLITLVVLGLIISSMADYWIGKAVSRIKGTYRNDIAQLGKIGKVSGIFLVMFIALAEHMAAEHQVINTRGILSVAVGCWLIFGDLESIIRHREAAGAHTPAWLIRFLQMGRGQIDKRVNAFLAKQETNG